MANEIITQDGEILPDTQSDRADRARDVDMGAMVSLARAEIDIQIATARKYPRSMTRVMTQVTSLATIDEETAEECCYALLRKKKGNRQVDDEEKAIEGPSIRLAEIAAQVYGNCRIDARVITVNRQEKYVEAEGIFHDLETNMASRATVRRRISTTKGYLFSDDMIVVTGNAACAIAKRNAILSGIPRSIIRPAYKAARGVIAGTIQTLGQNRAKVYKAFASYSVTPAQIHELLGVGGEADVGLDHIAVLRATFSSIKNGEATIDEIFPRERVGEGVQDPLGSGKPATKKPEVPDATKGTEAKASSDETVSGVLSEKTDVVETSAKAEGEVAASPSAKESVGNSTVSVSAGTSVDTASPQSDAAGASGPAPAVKDISKIKTDVEYAEYVKAYVAAATSASALKEQWNKERPFRTSLNVGLNWLGETLPMLKKMVEDRAKELADTVL